jgi:hypothetical protein
LIASESKSEKEMYLAMKNVISGCTFGALDVNSLPLVDMEYLFLKIRARSVGETSKPGISCSKCEKINSVEINIDQIEPVRSENHNSRINLTNSIIVEMRYPKYSDTERLSKFQEGTIVSAFELLALCIEKIHTPEKVFVINELPREEVDEFVENLTQTQFSKLMGFFETMPRLEHKIKMKCDKCSNEDEYVLRSVKDFF